MKTIVHILLLSIISVHALNVNAAEVEPVITYDHTSDIFRGRPFNDADELTADYIGAGVTLTLGSRRRVEIDITHGVLSVERAPAESASKLNVRWYPRRGR